MWILLTKGSSCHKTQDVPPCSSNQTITPQSCWTNRQIFIGWFSGISLTLRCHNVIQSDNHTLTSCLSCAAHRWIFQPCARQATPLWLAMSCKVLFFSSGMIITKQATVINWHIKRRLKRIWLTTRWRKKEAVSLQLLFNNTKYIYEKKSQQIHYIYCTANTLRN